MTQKIKILHLEDLPSDAELVARELKKGKINSEILVVDTEADFTGRLKDFLPDIILSDHSLPSFDSHHALRLVKETGINVPFILVTATISEEFAVNIMKEGAADYILKDRLQRLPSAVINSIEKYRLEIQRRKFLKNVIENEALLKEAQALAHVGNWEIDMVHNSQAWSDEMYKIFGIKKGEAMPSIELLLSFIHPDDLNYAKGKIEEAFKTLQNSSFDFRLIRKDGIVRYGYSEWRFEFDENKNPVRLFGIVQDVTEIKVAETERAKMVNDLMLRNKDLEQFAYIVSHNLRAPVANILGATSGLNDSGLGGEEKDILMQGLSESVTRLDNVVKDLNHVLQVKQEINTTKEKVHFSELVSDIKISIKNLIDSDNIEIKYDFSEMDEFLTIKSYLYSIFYNLISNSIKYRQQQVPCLIEIKSRQEKDAIELIFTDNGMGIDLEKRGGQVFGLYKRFHTNIEGKGMGLFMVKTQVEALGGKIAIRSQVNKGTEFKIKFEI